MMTNMYKIRKTIEYSRILTLFLCSILAISSYAQEYRNNPDGYCQESDIEEKTITNILTGDLFTVKVVKEGVRCCGDGKVDYEDNEECDLGLYRNGVDVNNVEEGTSTGGDGLQDYGCSKDCKVNKTEGWECNKDCTEYAKMHKKMTDLYREIIVHINSDNAYCYNSNNLSDVKCQSIIDTLNEFKSINKHFGICYDIKKWLQDNGKKYTEIPDPNYPAKDIKVNVNFMDCNIVNKYCRLRPQSLVWGSSRSNTIKAGTRLYSGDYLCSQNNQYKLILQESDGSLVVYKKTQAGQEVVWNNGRKVDWDITKQSDYCLELYNGYLMIPLSCSNPPKMEGQYLGFWLAAIYNLYPKDSTSKQLVYYKLNSSGQYEFLADPDLESKAILQDDGNFVLYNKDGLQLWASGPDSTAATGEVFEECKN